MATLTEHQKRQLKAEYNDARKAGENLLEWCAKKSRECDMSYGEFVTLLGI